MDYTAMKKRMDEWFESPEGKASMERQSRRIIREDERKTQAWEFLESLSDEEYKKFIYRLVEWEEQFEEREYQKGKLKSSNIFGTIFSAISHNAEECDDEDNMFFSGGSTYRGFNWKVYVGQGSFYTIEENGERIFTST